MDGELYSSSVLAPAGDLGYVPLVCVSKLKVFMKNQGECNLSAYGSVCVFLLADQN